MAEGKLVSILREVFLFTVDKVRYVKIEPVELNSDLPRRKWWLYISLKILSISHWSMIRPNMLKGGKEGRSLMAALFLNFSRSCGRDDLHMTSWS